MFGSEPDEVNHLKSYQYRWFHIPSGKNGLSSQKFICRKDFLEALAKWNRLGHGVWKYSEV